MEDLEMVDLSLTNVTGDIAAFQGKDYLERLVLASTLVFGDIERLVPVGGKHPYEVIDLSRTNILGNIWVFQNAKHLLELYLADTIVAGATAIEATSTLFSNVFQTMTSFMNG